MGECPYRVEVLRVGPLRATAVTARTSQLLADTATACCIDVRTGGIVHLIATNALFVDSRRGGNRMTAPRKAAKKPAKKAPAKKAAAKKTTARKTAAKKAPARKAAAKKAPARKAAAKRSR
jgi:hypothetical protein